MPTKWKQGDHILGRWELQEVIDRGGMGLIYVVVDRKNGSILAAKTFKDAAFERGHAVAQRFAEEAAVWIALGDHPNVTPALYMDRIEEKPFLFLPYVDGGDLSRWIGVPGLVNNPAQVAGFAVDVCDGMTFIGSKGIQAHRDLKPHNCLVTSHRVVMITDFGISKIFDDPDNDGRTASQASLGSTPPNVRPAHLTRTGIAVGTPAYMAPEQFLDAKHVTARSDIYSFGVMLFQMITGELPFRAATREELAELHIHAPIPRADIDPAFMSVIENCLAKNPMERFRDFQSVRERLQPFCKQDPRRRERSRAGGPKDQCWEITQRADGLTVLGRHQEALALCEQALSISPSYAWALLVKGKCLGTFGRREEALECLQLSSSLDPDNEHVWRIKAWVLGDLGRTNDAIAAFSRAIELNPLRADLWRFKADKLVDAGRLDAALICYERALALDARYRDALFGKCAVLGTLGRIDEALASVDPLLELDPFDNMAADLKLRLLQSPRDKAPTIAVAHRFKSSSATDQHETKLSAEDLGVMFANGDGVPQDYAEARRWFQKAATAESHAAMNHLGVMHAEGLGVARDDSKARLWFEKAAAYGNDEAMYNLGNLHRKGLRYKEARIWYEQSAGKGHTGAMIELGHTYALGHGVGRDTELGRRWVENAAAAGDISALRLLEAPPFKREREDEAAAFFWFNSEIITDPETCMYGRSAYAQLLPWFAPARQQSEEVWFVLFDGDCLTDSSSWSWYFRKEDGLLLQEAKRVGENLCYVIAVLGQGAQPLDDIDRQLREANALGYMGMTRPDLFEHETLLRCQRAMALVPAVRIDGARFKRISYGFHADRELRAMGFEPYSEVNTSEETSNE